MRSRSRKAPMPRDGGSDHGTPRVLPSPSGGTLPITRDITDEEYHAQWDRITDSARPSMEWQPYLKYLPDIEAEIFWLLQDRRKHQKDAAAMLGLSQSTISYRFKRAVDKLVYIVMITSAELPELLGQLNTQMIPILKDREIRILTDLFYYTNQDRVGQLHGTRQSTVKWIMLKARRRAEALEREKPERWHAHLGLLLLLERHLGTRIWPSDEDQPPQAHESTSIRK